LAVVRGAGERWPVGGGGGSLTTDTPTYRDRYLSGERERVWDELVALGAAVREEPVYADALAVARETMRRARANIDRLIPRLVSVGFLFGYGWLQPPASQPFGWREREWYRASLDWARKQPPILSSATDADEELADMRVRLLRLGELAAPPEIVAHWAGRVAAAEAAPRDESPVDAFERDVGLLPLSVRAWYEVGGGVNFVGLHPGWLNLLSDADAAVEEAREREAFLRSEVGRPFHRLAQLEPLFVYPLDAARAWEDGHSPGVYHLPLMPDPSSLFGEHGEPWERTIDLPCAGADALLHPGPHGTTFVNYLRTCFRWGGFPGWGRVGARPERDLSFLTEGLLPI
jgi:hypothetical protein